MPKYYTGASLVMKNREEKKEKFEKMLAKAKEQHSKSGVDQYYYDPKTKTHKRRDS